MEVVDKVMQDVIGKNIGFDCYTDYDIDLIAEYIKNDTSCFPEENIPAIPCNLPISSIPNHHLHVNNIASVPASSTSSPPHVTTPSYNTLRAQAIPNGPNLCYDNPVMHPTLPDSPPDSEPYSPPDGHPNNHSIVVTTQENKYGVNPAMHHMYPPHHRPPGIHTKSMPPGYNEPPVLNHMPPAPVSHPDPSTSTPIPLSASGMNQMISPQHSIATHPSQKKRKYSDSPNNTLTNALLNGRHDMLNIKQEPTGSNFSGYLGDCEEDYNYDPDSSNSGFMDSSYQVIKWQAFNMQKWTALTDSNLKDLPPPQYRIDSDKGFNFSTPDEAFVCQKKNHFQVTAHIAIPGEPRYVRTPEGVKKIDAFYLHFYGVKVESQSQIIKIEQSQSDRSKKPFHPVRVDLIPNQTNKMTVGRLHFSETTSNNMRKKGRPNPDQRYFMLVVALHAHCGENDYMVAASSSERLIVRASNPGQFDNDVDVMWQKAQTPDGVYHVGRVGVNTDHPEEALTVHGNMRLTGHLLQPSDQRVKEKIKAVNSKEQLKNVAQINIYEYNYKEDFAESVGLPEHQRRDTGVIAQEVQTVLPDAVMQTGDVALNSGKNVDNLLVVNKDRIFMENVGAVKELCKLTDNLEVRIDELEKMNKKLSKLKRYDSLKSTISSKSTCSVSTVSSTPPPKKPSSSSQKYRQHHHHHHHSSNHHSNRKTPLPTDNGWCSNRFIQIIIITLILIMAFCLVAITVLYILERHNKDSHSSTPSPAVNDARSLPHRASTKQPTITTTASRISPFGHNPTTTQKPSTTTTSRTVIHTLPVIEFSPDCSVPQACESYCCSQGQNDGPGHYIPEIINPYDNQPDVVIDDNNTERNETHESTDHKESNELPGEDKTTTKKPEDHNIIVEVINNSNEIQPGYSNIVGNVGNVDTNMIQNTYFSRRKKRNTEFEDLYADIVIKERNVTLDDRYCDPKIPSACIDRNFTYSVKFSQYFPYQAFTVVFNTSTNNAVYLCYNYTHTLCSDELFNDIDSSVPYQWKIPVTHYFSSRFTFRVAPKGIGNVCTLPEGSIIKFAEYTLKFMRQC